MPVPTWTSSSSSAAEAWLDAVCNGGVTTIALRERYREIVVLDQHMPTSAS